MEKSDAVGFASLDKIQVSVEGEQLDDLTATGVSFMRVKGKFLYAYVFSKYENPKDLEWVRATSSRWVDQILSTNLAQGRPTQTAIRSSKSSGFDWNRVIAKGIVGAIIGGFLALIVGAIYGLKRLFGKRKS